MSPVVSTRMKESMETPEINPFFFLAESPNHYFPKEQQYESINVSIMKYVTIQLKCTEIEQRINRILCVL
jgi:hypothetical protein